MLQVDITVNIYMTNVNVILVPGAKWKFSFFILYVHAFQNILMMINLLIKVVERLSGKSVRHFL
jgi:hypothetical protein